MLKLSCVDTIADIEVMEIAGKDAPVINKCYTEVEGFTTATLGTRINPKPISSGPK